MTRTTATMRSALHSLLKPLDLPDDAEIAGFDTGSRRLCAWAKDGRAWCWTLVGSSVGREGQSVASAPRRILSKGDVVQLAVSDHLCLRRSTGRVECWGNNSEGQVGNERRTKTSRSFYIKF